MKIVAVSACPTGLAFTYLAAEALKSEAKNQGHAIKVETQGVTADNILSNKDIKEADLVIIATDKKIDLSRFNGKRVYQTTTNKVVKNAKSVIEKAINNSEVYSHTHEEVGDAPKIGIYGHLMTGVSYMLPFVIAGGIIIAMSFAFGIHAGDITDPSYNVIAAALSQIGGGISFALMVPILAAGVAFSIAGKQGIAPGMVVGTLAVADGAGFIGGVIGGLLAGYFTSFLERKLVLPNSISSLGKLILIPLVSILVIGLAMKFLIGQPISIFLEFLTDWLKSLGTSSGVLFGLLIGAMVASDMGGPLNKSICAFSIGLMATGVYQPIAACMVAGMTPPLGLALATILFKNKFTQTEKEAGKSCWILGASFITEGAIPFAVADPIRVIPSIMLGSAVAAGISLGWGVGSLAPHGGIWVIAIPGVISNVFVYILALLAGSVTTALAVGTIKREVV